MTKAVGRHGKLHRHERLVVPIINRAVEGMVVGLVQHPLPDLIAHQTFDEIVPDHVLIEPAHLALRFHKDVAIKAKGCRIIIGVAGDQLQHHPIVEPQHCQLELRHDDVLIVTHVPNNRPSLTVAQQVRLM